MFIFKIKIVCQTSMDVWIFMITMTIIRHRHTMTSWNTAAIFYLWPFTVLQSDIESNNEIISEKIARYYIPSMPFYFWILCY